MTEVRWSAELQERDPTKVQSCCTRRRCALICASGVVGSVVLTIISLIVIWLLFGNADNLAETAAAGRIQGDNYTAADWERLIVASGPEDFAKADDGSVYYLVSYSENIDDYFTAMGTEQSLLWMARAFDERISFWNTNGDRTFHTKLSWKFLDILERDWRFRLGEEFRTTFGRNLGDSLMTIRLAGPYALLCEEHHEERPEWRVTTTFEFYQLGIVRTYELPYENNLVAKKFYEKVSGGQKSGSVHGSAKISTEAEDTEDFWNTDEWD